MECVYQCATDLDCKVINYRDDRNITDSCEFVLFINESSELIKDSRYAAYYMIQDNSEQVLLVLDVQGTIEFHPHYCKYI